jgi:hypothetical protein
LVCKCRACRYCPDKCSALLRFFLKVGDGRRFLFFCLGIMDIFFRGFAVLACIPNLHHPVPLVTWHHLCYGVGCLRCRRDLVPRSHFVRMAFHAWHWNATKMPLWRCWNCNEILKMKSCNACCKSIAYPYGYSDLHKFIIRPQAASSKGRYARLCTMAQRALCQ